MMVHRPFFVFVNKDDLYIRLFHGPEIITATTFPGMAVFRNEGTRWGYRRSLLRIQKSLPFSALFINLLGLFLPLFELFVLPLTELTRPKIITATAILRRVELLMNLIASPLQESFPLLLLLFFIFIFFVFSSSFPWTS